MPPHEQHPVLVINNHGGRGAPHAHHVLLKLGAIWQLD